MIKILKGDTSADISFALAEGFDYSGATVHVEYQGAVKTFTGCAAGDVLALRFSADETAVMSLGSYPVVVRITNPSGLMKTIQNSNTKICVTDDPAEVSGGAIALDVKGTLYGIEDLPERWTEADIVAKLREIMRRGGAVLCALLTFSAFGASVQTARKDAIHNDEQIVTNVIFDAAPDFTTNNQTLVDTIVAKSPPPDMSGVVHGDDRVSDKSAFSQGLKFRASDDDGGNLRFRISDPGGAGLRYYSDSTDTSLGSPWFALTAFGITHPTDNANNPYCTTSWFDFTRAHTVLDTMPSYEAPGGSGRQNYQYPISAGAFLDYFWNIYNLPTAAANRFADTRTMKAASNLVDNAGSLVRAEDIEERAAQLTATSTIPIYAYSVWTSDWPSDDEVQPLQPVWSNGNWSVTVKEVEGNGKWGPYSIAGAADALTFTVSIMGYATVFNRTATEAGDRNAYGLARTSDITNTVNKAYVEGLGIESGLQEESDPVWLAEKGNYATVQEVRAVSNESAVVTRLFMASNVIDEVTNYNSVARLPSRRLYQLNESNEYVKVWDEMAQHTNTLGKAQTYTDNATGTLAQAVAPKAWSRVTSGLGAEAPSNTTWISTPTTVLAGGMEYAKVVHANGAVWVLSGNGMMNFDPTTNAYLRITADDGTEVFSIEKTDAVTVGADAEGITVAGGVITIPVPVVSTEHPTMLFREQLNSGDWSDESTFTADTGGAVSWGGVSGDWVCTVTFNGLMPPSGFFKFTYLREGSTVVRHGAATDLGGGITINGTTYQLGTATINGHTVLTLTAAP